LIGTAQPFLGVFETSRVEYAPLADLNGLNSTTQAEINQALRTFVMFPQGQNFRPTFTVTRGDLAAAMVFAGRAPQYTAAQPRYPDVRDRSTRVFVESVQTAPSGPLFMDAPLGSSFRPLDRVDRLTAAIVLVRAAGLTSEVAGAGPLPVLDTAAIPYSLRGYVSVALSYGLLKPSGSNFSPQSSLTRADLAHALAVMNKLAAG
jgi:hypothetical protein